MEQSKLITNSMYVCVCMYVYIYICMYVCVYVCMYVKVKQSRYRPGVAQRVPGS